TISYPSPELTFSTRHLRLRVGSRGRRISNDLLCQFDEPTRGGSLNSRTRLFPAVRMSKSSRQYTWWWCRLHTHELDTAENPKRGRIVPSVWRRHSLTYRYHPASISHTSTTSCPWT